MISKFHYKFVTKISVAIFYKHAFLLENIFCSYFLMVTPPKVVYYFVGFQDDKMWRNDSRINSILSFVKKDRIFIVQEKHITCICVVAHSNPIIIRHFRECGTCWLQCIKYTKPKRHLDILQQYCSILAYKINELAIGNKGY